MLKKHFVIDGFQMKKQEKYAFDNEMSIAGYLIEDLLEINENKCQPQQHQNQSRVPRDAPATEFQPKEIS